MQITMKHLNSVKQCVQNHSQVIEQFDSKVIYIYICCSHSSRAMHTNSRNRLLSWKFYSILLRYHYWTMSFVRLQWLSKESKQFRQRSRLYEHMRCTKTERQTSPNFDVHLRFFNYLCLDICLQPKIVGNCQERRASWYFDVKDQECKSFTYSGLCNLNYETDQMKMSVIFFLT